MSIRIALISSTALLSLYILVALSLVGSFVGPNMSSLVLSFLGICVIFLVLSVVMIFKKDKFRIYQQALMILCNITVIFIPSIFWNLLK